MAWGAALLGVLGATQALLVPRLAANGRAVRLLSAAMAPRRGVRGCQVVEMVRFKRDWGVGEGRQGGSEPGRTRLTKQGVAQAGVGVLSRTGGLSGPAL